jgi:hypothetical protein
MRADSAGVGIVSQRKWCKISGYLEILDLFEEIAVHRLHVRNVFKRLWSRCSLELE